MSRTGNRSAPEADPRIPFPFTDTQTACQIRPEWFSHEQTSTRAAEKDIAKAKDACSGCPIVKNCLTWALAHPDLTQVGVWAATTTRQRGQLRRRLESRLGPDWVGVLAQREQAARRRTRPPRDTAAIERERAFALLDDLADLLGALGLPCGEGDLVRLLPHLTIPTGDPMPVNAFTATAVSMLNNGDSPEHVRETLGLSESELADALQHAGLPVSDADTEDSTSTPETAASAPASTTDADQIEALLAWAENHSAATIRNRAARVHSDLTELTERRASDAAQSAAEDRVAKARAELEAAQAELRQVKAGSRITTEDPATTSFAPVQGPGGKRSSEELAAIRTWARANGHQVADRGNPAKTVLDAYDAAHRTTALAEAS